MLKSSENYLSNLISFYTTFLSCLQKTTSFIKKSCLNIFSKFHNFKYITIYKAFSIYNKLISLNSTSKILDYTSFIISKILISQLSYKKPGQKFQKILSKLSFYPVFIIAFTCSYTSLSNFVIFSISNKLSSFRLGFKAKTLTIRNLLALKPTSTSDFTIVDPISILLLTLKLDSILITFYIKANL